MLDAEAKKTAKTKAVAPQSTKNTTKKASNTNSLSDLGKVRNTLTQSNKALVQKGVRTGKVTLGGVSSKQQTKRSTSKNEQFNTNRSSQKDPKSSITSTPNPFKKASSKKNETDIKAKK